MGSAEVSEAQQTLRLACQTGDIKAFQTALMPQAHTWTQTLWNWLRGRDQDKERLPARLDYVYEDDQCNLPVHYLANGASIGRLQHLLFGCLPISRQSKPTGNYDRDRAELVEWLSVCKHSLDVAAVNAELDTAIHCAVCSNSPATLQALLITAAGSDSLANGCLAERNAQGQQALDMALQGRQWYAVQMLVTAGALQECAALDMARRQLQEAMLMQSSTTQSGLATLVAGVSRLFGALLGPTPRQDPLSALQPPTLQAEAYEMEVETSFPYSPGHHQTSCLVFLPDSEAVLLHRHDAIHLVMAECRVDESIATLLLSGFHGKAEAACKAWLQQPAGALEACGMSAEFALLLVGHTPDLATANSPQCLVCFEDIVPHVLTVHLPCGHSTCDDCWQGILTAAIKDGNLKQAACPHPGCRLPIAPGQVPALLDAQSASRFQQLLAQQHVNVNPHTKWCPSPDCTGSLAFQPAAAGQNSSMAQAVSAGRPVDVVCCCGHAFCFACSAEPHEPATCQQAAEWAEVLAKMREEDKQDASLWVRRNTQPCPGCGSRIQKNGGCNHMSCSVCRLQFCWIDYIDQALRPVCLTLGACQDFALYP